MNFMLNIYSDYISKVLPWINLIKTFFMPILSILYENIWRVWGKVMYTGHDQNFVYIGKHLKIHTHEMFCFLESALNVKFSFYNLNLFNWCVKTWSLYILFCGFSLFPYLSPSWHYIIRASSKALTEMCLCFWDEAQ